MHATQAQKLLCVHTWALYIHKVGVRRLDQSFLLVLSSLKIKSWVEEVFG